MQNQYKDQRMSIVLKCFPSHSEIFMKSENSAEQILFLNYRPFEHV